MEVMVIDEFNQLGRMSAWIDFFKKVSGLGQLHYIEKPADVAVTKSSLLFAHRRVWRPEAFDKFVTDRRKGGLRVEGWCYSSKPQDVFTKTPDHIRYLQSLPDQEPLFGNGAGIARSSLHKRIEWLKCDPDNRLGLPSVFDEEFEFRT